ncbi:hypothetical protein T36_1326 [Helicobacter cinaedi]|nr:hypothetical protein T36_1326 [Helicobacter cinaedi]
MSGFCGVCVSLSAQGSRGVARANRQRIGNEA